MFKTYKFKLDEHMALNRLSIPVFTHHLLQQVSDAQKVQVDPIEGRQVTVSYLPSVGSEVLEAQIRRFLQQFKQEESSEIVDAGIERVEVQEPPLAQLCSCCHGPNKANISDELIERGWVKLLRDQELGMAGEIVQLIEFFDRSFVQYVAERVGAYEERSYSVLLPTYYVEKMNYLQSAPLHLFFATHLSHDQERIASFEQGVKQQNGQLPNEATEYLDKPRHVLQSAPCFKVYFELENQVLPGDKTYCVRGLSFRNEGKRVHMLERLLNFNMREFVFVGTPEFVTSMRDSTLRWTVEWMESIGLTGECTLANDPFFMTEETRKRFRVPSRVKYEVRAEIPYKQDSLSIASFDTHGDFFSKTFEISRKDEAEVWSGCIGLGLERAVWSFLQQYGLESAKWPEFVREQVCALTVAK